MEEHVPESRPESDQGSTTAGVDKTTASADTPQWIRNLGAIVTIISVIAGLCFTAYQLALKAHSDQETAQLNREAEADRLTLGKAQLLDQSMARKEQAQQHSEDLNLDLEKHRLDIQHEEQLAQRAAAQDESKQLTLTISRLFSDNVTGREGDLAALFAHVKDDPSNLKAVMNAIRVRLENPGSVSEIDIGLSVLDAIGSPAIDYTLEINRAARKRYDSYLFTKFSLLRESYFREHAEKAPTPFRPVSPILISHLESAVADALPLPLPFEREYALAVISEKLRERAQPIASNPDTKNGFGYSPLELSISTLHRSLDTLQKQVEELERSDSSSMSFDARDTYLTLLKIDDRRHISKVRFDLRGSFLGYTSGNLPNYAQTWPVNCREVLTLNKTINVVYDSEDPTDFSYEEFTLHPANFFNDQCP